MGRALPQTMRLNIWAVGGVFRDSQHEQQLTLPPKKCWVATALGGQIRRQRPAGKGVRGHQGTKICWVAEETPKLPKINEKLFNDIHFWLQFQLQNIRIQKRN